MAGTASRMSSWCQVKVAPDPERAHDGGERQHRGDRPASRESASCAPDAPARPGPPGHVATIERSDAASTRHARPADVARFAGRSSTRGRARSLAIMSCSGNTPPRGCRSSSPSTTSGSRSRDPRARPGGPDPERDRHRRRLLHGRHSGLPAVGSRLSSPRRGDSGRRTRRTRSGSSIRNPTRARAPPSGGVRRGQRGHRASPGR